MRNKDKFTIFENADDNFIDRLEDYPIVSDDEKERIFEMSKRKYYQMVREGISVTYDSRETEKTVNISGADNYTGSSLFRKIIPFAGSFAAVAAVALGVFIMGDTETIAPDVIHPTTAEAPKVMAETTAVSKITKTTGATDVTETKIQQDSEKDNSIYSVDAEAELEGSEIETSGTGENNDSLSSYEDEIYGITEELLYAVDVADMFISGRIATEYIVTCESNGREYERVTDPRFSCCDDVRNYLNEHFTENMINSRYYNLIDSQNPFIVDVNGELYAYVAPKGFGNQYVTDDSGRIDAKFLVDDDEHFTALVKYYDYGSVSTLRVRCINENGVWKIDSME